MPEEKWHFSQYLSGARKARDIVNVTVRVVVTECAIGKPNEGAHTAGGIENGRVYVAGFQLAHVKHLVR